MFMYMIHYQWLSAEVFSSFLLCLFCLFTPRIALPVQLYPKQIDSYWSPDWSTHAITDLVVYRSVTCDGSTSAAIAVTHRAPSSLQLHRFITGGSSNYDARFSRPTIQGFSSYDASTAADQLVTNASALRRNPSSFCVFHYPPLRSNDSRNSGLAIPPHQTWQTVKKRKRTHLTPLTSQLETSSVISRNWFDELSHLSDNDTHKFVEYLPTTAGTSRNQQAREHKPPPTYMHGVTIRTLCPL